MVRKRRAILASGCCSRSVPSFSHNSDEIICYPEGCAAPGGVRCQCYTRGSLSKLEREPPHVKMNVTSKSPVGDISVVTLIRTDTTLDHSQKAEKVCHFLGRPLLGSSRPRPRVVSQNLEARAQARTRAFRFATLTLVVARKLTTS